MSDAETRYAQIETELLAVVFFMEKFNEYTFGRKIILQTDHKLLVTIFQKPLNKAPRRLQAILWRLHKYDCEIVYTPGKNMVL